MKKSEHIFQVCFFSVYFLYVCLCVNPALHYAYDPPEFFLDSRYFSGFLTYPGGCIDFVSAFFGQFFFYSWAGAIIFTLISFGVSYFTRLIINKTAPGTAPGFLQYVPALLLLIGQCDYTVPLSLCTGFLITVFFFHIYMCLSPESTLRRSALFSGLGVFLYFSSGSSFLFFTLLCGIYEGIVRKRYLQALFYCMGGAILPYVATAFLFLDSIANGYGNLSIFALHPIHPHWMYLLPYLYYPLLLVLVGVPSFERTFRTVAQKPRPGFKAAFFPVAAVAAACLSFNSGLKTTLQVCLYAQQERWADVLAVARKSGISNGFMTHCQCRALFHQGRLLSDLFLYQNNKGSSGLFLENGESNLTLRMRSDLFFELGNISESQHWAYESLSVFGEAPWALRRLIRTHLLKGEYEAARLCAARLKKNPVFKHWAAMPQIPGAVPGMPAEGNELMNGNDTLCKNDFINLSISQSERTLGFFSKADRSNKMAFEYLVAQHLLSADLQQIADDIPLFIEQNYTEFPRAFEEALLAYSVAAKRKDFLPPDYFLHPETIRDFANVMDILARYGNTIAAGKELAERFGSTFWYYSLFVHSS